MATDVPYLWVLPRKSYIGLYEEEG